MSIRFRLNGKNVTVTPAFPGITLMEYLRKEGFYGVKYGCDRGECGSCATLVDGLAVNSCLLLLELLDGKNVETVESLSRYDKLHPVQEKFLDAGAIQCGYCTPGMVISLEALLRKVPKSGEAEVRDALSGNLCRCTGYVKPVEALSK